MVAGLWSDAQRGLSQQTLRNHRDAKLIVSIRVGRLKVGLLAPDVAAAADEDVGRAGLEGAVVSAVPVYARAVTVLQPRPDDNSISGHSHGIAE